ncbi:hypothetical protein [Niallia taxi]|uniref:hypothetical protein n=1 Tax=Niallia taxi TaxID=2499688 RepID=UPI003D266009
MSTIRLSMPVAFFIENCLTSGLPLETIIDSIKQQQFSVFKDNVQDREMDFNERYQVAEQLGEDWETAIKSGYELKWLHMNGLKKLLNFRFNKVADMDYLQDGYVISSLSLNHSEYEILSSMVNSQWNVFSDDTNEGRYRIELKYKNVM